MGAPSPETPENADSGRQPVWPVRVASLAGELRSAVGDAPKNELLGAVWLLLTTAVDQYVRRHGARVGRIDDDEREDVVSEKALDLIRKLDSGVWRPEVEHPGKVAAFVSTVARNGLLDVLRKSGPMIREELDPSMADPRSVAVSSEGETRVDRREFVAGLRDCVGQLGPKARSVWFLRVFYDLPSKVIAQHPEVQSTLQNVDVTLLRTRRKVRDCMQARGFDVTEIPRGTYEVMWHAFRLERIPDPEEQGD